MKKLFCKKFQILRNLRLSNTLYMKVLQGIYRYVDRELKGQALRENKNNSRPSSWTSEKKARLNRLVTNKKGISQKKLGLKFDYLHVSTNIIVIPTTCFGPIYPVHIDLKRRFRRWVKCSSGH